MTLLAAVLIALMPSVASASTTPPGTAIYVYDSVDTSRSDASSVAGPILSLASYWVGDGSVPDGLSGGTTGNRAATALAASARAAATRASTAAGITDDLLRTGGATNSAGLSDDLIRLSDSHLAGSG